MMGRKRQTRNFSSDVDFRTYHLDTLPDEILKHIITFITKRTFIQARLISKRFGKVTDSLWILMYRQTWQVPHRLIIVPSHLISVDEMYYYNTQFEASSPISPAVPTSETTTTSLASQPIDHHYHLHHSIFDVNTSHYNSNNVYYGQSYRPLMYSFNTFNHNQYGTLYNQSNNSNLTSEEQCGLLWKHLFFERCKILNFGVLLKVKKSTNSKLSLLSRSSHKDPDHYTDKGYANIYRNDYMKAVSSFEKANRMGPSARAYEGLARIYQQFESPPHVIIFAEAALKFNPVNPGELYYLRGKALFGMNRMHEALNDFTRAITFLSVSPVNYHLFLKTSEVYFDRMMTNVDLGFFDQAYSDCEMITKTERYFEGGDCYLKCAKVLFDKKHFEQAERFLLQVKTKTIEYYLLFMQVQCVLGKYDESLKSYRSYEAELSNVAHNTSSTPTLHPTVLGIGKEILMEIGITLIMNNFIEEGIEKFTESAMHKYHAQFSTLKEREIKSAKQRVTKAALRQINEYGRYFDDPTICPVDIHMAWSFYYFLVGMFYFLKKTSRLSSVMSPLSQNEDLKVALTNFTRCITLNPTLSESFYYRALLQCYLLLDLPVAALCNSPTNTGNLLKPTSINSLLLQRVQLRCSNSESTTSPREGYQRVAQKIAVTNLMREALNDVNNALTLMTLNIYEPFSEFTTNSIHVNTPLIDTEVKLTDDKCYEEEEMISYMINIHLLKAHILHCFGRQQEALVECDMGIELEKQCCSISPIPHPSYNASKCYTLRAVISKQKDDVQRALDYDTENKLLAFPSLGQRDLLGVIIYLSASECNFEQLME